jgi:hypothetical protein
VADDEDVGLAGGREVLEERHVRGADDPPLHGRQVEGGREALLRGAHGAGQLHLLEQAGVGAPDLGDLLLQALHQLLAGFLGGALPVEGVLGGAQAILQAAALGRLAPSFRPISTSQAVSSHSARLSPWAARSSSTFSRV